MISFKTQKGGPLLLQILPISKGIDKVIFKWSKRLSPNNDIQGKQ